MKPDVTRGCNIVMAIAEVIERWREESWVPKELHLSVEDWWAARDYLRATEQKPPLAWFAKHLTFEFHGVYIVVNPLFETGNYRFDPIAPTSVGARMIVALDAFRRGIKST